MIAAQEKAAIQARRALLREQTARVGRRLPWLTDPQLIPDEAVDASVGADDVPLSAFSLAAWMLIQVLHSAQQEQDTLDWGRAMAGVAPGLQASVQRSVLCPAAKYAPGLFAIAEIVAVVPAVAFRSEAAPARWRGIAHRAQAFGALLARDGTGVQVLLRHYLARPADDPAGCGLRALHPACLRLDDALGLTTVTPLDDLLAAARQATLRHDGCTQGVCVALQAPAPHGCAGGSMFGAIWSSFADAAARLVFPRFDPQRPPIPACAAPDGRHAEILDRLAAGRGAQLRKAAAQPWPPAAERVLGNLIAAHAASCAPGRPAAPG